MLSLAIIFKRKRDVVICVFTRDGAINADYRWHYEGLLTRGHYITYLWPLNFVPNIDRGLSIRLEIEQNETHQLLGALAENSRSLITKKFELIDGYIVRI